MKQRIFAFMLVLVMVLSLGSACSSPDKKTDTTATAGSSTASEAATDSKTATDPSASQETASSESASSQPATVSDGVFTYNAILDPPTLDPQLNTKSEGSLVNNNLFEGLVTIASDGKVLPGVAKDWTASDDGLVYTFNLNPDAKWSDGKPVVAADFAYAWERALNPANTVKSVNYMFVIKNAKAYYEGKKDFSEVGIRLVNDQTIELTLESPVTYIMELLNFGVFKPVRKDIVEANPDSWTLKPETCVSNGPYKLAEYAMNERIVLEKDENYWNKDNSGFIRKIKFVFIEDASTALNAFTAGEVDALESIPKDEIQRLAMEGDQLKIVPGLGTSYFAFNVTNPPFDNVNVRKAFNLAINREEITKAFVKGQVRAATGFVPTGLTIEGVDFREEGDKNGVSFPTKGDVEAAKAALAEAGYPNGEGLPEVEYLYSTSASNKLIAEMLQKMWKQNLNVDVKLTNVERAVESERRHGGQFQMARASWGADFSHPMTFLDLFTSEAGNNTPQHRVKAYDDLIAQAKNSLTEAESLAFLHQAEDMILSNYVVCPLYYNTRMYLISDQYDHIMFSPMGKVNIAQIKPKQ